MGLSEQILIKENFFDDPFYIRKVALSSSYFPCDFSVTSSIFSGFRAQIQNKDIISKLNQDLQNLLKKEISYLTYKFHLNPSICMHGVPHTDSDSENGFAGVVYLNENVFVENSGTTIYNDLPDDKTVEDYIDDYRSKIEIIYSTALSSKNKFKLKFSEECLEFKKNALTPIATIDNMFNRLVCYPSRMLHSPDFYFGDAKTSSRLTLVFHGELNAK